MSRQVREVGRHQAIKETSTPSQKSAEEAKAREPTCHKARSTTRQVSSLRQRVGRERRDQRCSDVGRQLRTDERDVTRQRERTTGHGHRSEKVSEWGAVLGAAAKLYPSASRGHESANEGTNAL